MFTGIIERTLHVIGVADGPRFRRLTLPNPWADVKPGESIAVNGCCLTVAEMPPGELGFDVITETLAKTNLGSLLNNDAVNVERSLRLGDRLDGHFVQGHVDGVAKLLGVASGAEEWRLTLDAPPHLAKYLVPKGSVTLDGVSLTIARIEPENRRHFQVALIPTTMEMTTLGDRTPGYLFNLEADVMCKTIVSHLEHFAPQRESEE